MLKAAKGTKLKLELLDTNQHYDSSLNFLPSDFKLPKAPLSPLSWISFAIDATMQILKDNNYLAVIAIGDTNSTLVASLAAKRSKITLIHVEAGLRSGDPLMPEEINRRLCDQFADILFAPTKSALKNLKNENILKPLSFVVGDINYDAFLESREKARHLDKKLPFESDYYIFTMHRHDADLDFAIEFALYLKTNTLFIVHPRNLIQVKENFKKIFHSALKKPVNFKNIIFHPPMNHVEIIYTLEESRAVITDSGGLLRDAYYARKPALIMRETCEWKELLGGPSRLAFDREIADLPSDPDGKLTAVKERLRQAERSTFCQDNPLENHGAARRIVTTLSYILSKSQTTYKHFNPCPASTS